MNLSMTIPVYNEEARLAESVRRVASFFARRFPGVGELVVADNASTDHTPEIARALARELNGVRVVTLARKGRGGALRHSWLASEAEVLAYMDVDLSTELAHLPELIEAVASGKYDLATGSRLLPPRDIERGLGREVLSRGYNQLVRRAFWTRFSDAQCGFKAISRRAARALLPLVADNHWFFDTELLVLAEAAGCRIHDFPVRWRDHPQGSTVKVAATVWHMMRGIVRLKRRMRDGLAEEARRRWQTAGAEEVQATALAQKT